MSNQDNSHDTPVHVAIVGSGPSGFYAAEALLRSDLDVRVNMIERLPTPYGLVRSGVAPDHPKLKQSILVYDKVARHEKFNFLGNIELGRDVSIADLQTTHHGVVLACGANADKKMEIPGEDLEGSHTATEFVGWYNGHPDYRDKKFDLSQEVAVVVGQGNVAADVVRILAKPIDELHNTDIAAHALEALAESKIREIHIIGRRGPAQAKFTAKELRELGSITNTNASVNAQECVLNDQSNIELEAKTNTNADKNLEIFRSFAEQDTCEGQRKIKFRFCLSPIALKGPQRVQEIFLTRNRLEGPAFSQVARSTEETETISCGLVFRSIGYRGVPLPGLPFDFSAGVLSNIKGCVVDGNQFLRGLYVTGWLKRGANGIIGTNRADSIETIRSLRADIRDLTSETKPGIDGFLSILKTSGVKRVAFSDWLKIDSAEIERGNAKGKPREKFTRIDEMLDLLDR
ncbi:MAG: FAD-dependent oxidoreductase [Hyphomicrobiaceae bacterium]